MLTAGGGQAAARQASRKVANADIEAACVFHEVTKHSYTSVRAVPHYLDWNNGPMAYKIYPAAGAVALLRDLTLLSVFPVARPSSHTKGARRLQFIQRTYSSGH